MPLRAATGNISTSPPEVLEPRHILAERTKRRYVGNYLLLFWAKELFLILHLFYNLAASGIRLEGVYLLLKISPAEPSSAHTKLVFCILAAFRATHAAA